MKQLFIANREQFKDIIENMAIDVSMKLFDVSQFVDEEPEEKSLHSFVRNHDFIDCCNKLYDFSDRDM